MCLKRNCRGDLAQRCLDQTHSLKKTIGGQISLGLRMSKERAHLYSNFIQGRNRLKNLFGVLRKAYSLMVSHVSNDDETDDINKVRSENKVEQCIRELLTDWIWSLISIYYPQEDFDDTNVPPVFFCSKGVINCS